MHIPTKPQVLFVTPVFPDTTGYGLAMRAGALLEGLASCSAVYLLIIPFYAPDRIALPESMRPFCMQYQVLPTSKFERARACLKNAVRDLSHPAELPHVSRFTSIRLLRAVEQAFDQIHFDYLYLFRLYMIPFVLSCLSGTSFKSRCLDLDDIESLTSTRLADLYRANGLTTQAHQEEQTSQRYAAYERKFLPKFDGISVCSQQDKANISRLIPDQKIHILPNVVRQAVVSPAPESSGIFNMLFVGNLNYYPNQDALAFFIEDVLPVLRTEAKRPFRFTIIGSGKWPEQHRYRNISDCHYVGFVPDVSPCYEQAHAVVVPLRAGGGTRIKVLEAFSFKRPVITTSIGVEGIDVEPEKHVLIADQPEDFAKQCCRVMENQQLSGILTSNAYACLNDNYTLDVIRRRLSEMIV